MAPRDFVQYPQTVHVTGSLDSYLALSGSPRAHLVGSGSHLLHHQPLDQARVQDSFTLGDGVKVYLQQVTIFSAVARKNVETNKV